MSLLAAAASPMASAATTLRAVDPEPVTVPYAHPGGLGPYNPPIPSPCKVGPNYSEGVTHPSVWDFGPDKRWGGFRYWLAITDWGPGFTGENPNILCSQDGFNWQWPPGVTNPLWTANDVYEIHSDMTPLIPTGTRYNSDTELVYDADSDSLIVYFREMGIADTGPERLWSTESTDGIDWSDPVLRHDTEASANTKMSVLSPSICQDDSGTWWLFCWGLSSDVYTALSPRGPWVKQGATTGRNGWHGGVHYQDGVFYALSGSRGVGAASAAFTSRNGMTWVSHGPVMYGRTGEWDEGAVYRPTLRPHPDGKHFRVWFSTHDACKLGYTVIPRSRWGA